MHNEKRMSAWLFSLLIAGCGAMDGESLSESGPAHVGRAPVERPFARAAVTPVALPSSLTCVSSPSRQGNEVIPQVWRVGVAMRDGEGTLTLERGPQFRDHRGGTAPAASEPQVRAAHLASGRSIVILDDGHYGFSLSLARRGLFFVGSLVDNECYYHSQDAVTCWNEAEVMGSPWSGAPGAFGARFDWSKGRCVEGGEEALNTVPIEFVRETGYGECADLRGVSLNGDDFADPELAGWFIPGAAFDGATLYFAHLTSATLNGTRLRGLAMGYATVQGSTDRFTELPAGGTCETKQSPWSGATATCTR